VVDEYRVSLDASVDGRDGSERRPHARRSAEHEDEEWNAAVSQWELVTER
jgi:hypothetical protein